MTYGKEDALKTMQEIIDDKQGWQIAGNVKHTINGMDAQDYYERNAQKKYDELIANGYRTEANNLKNSNLEQAKKYINNYYVKTGRNQFRPYMYEKGKEYGLTSKDIDNLTSFDSETGEVIFAGKNIGKPDGISYNRSYFGSDYLDEVWDNYVNENGLTLPKDTVANQLSTKAMNYIDKLAAQQSGNRDYIMSTGKEQRQRKDDFINSQQNADIFKTDAAKTIMDKFNYMGGVAGGNAVAEGASSNGGNIDSFSAANRARQQLAYTSAGADAVISEYQNRMNNIMDTLKSIDSQNVNEYGALSINHQNGLDTSQLYTNNAKQLYDVIDREKQTDNNIKLSDRESKGYFYDYSSNPFLNEDGSVKDINRDYTAIYNDAMARKDEQTAKWASEAAYQKYMSDPSQYGKHYNPAIHKLNPEDYKRDTANVGANKLNVQTQIELQTLLNEATKLGYDNAVVLARIAQETEKYDIDAQKYIAELNKQASKDPEVVKEVMSGNSTKIIQSLEESQQKTSETESQEQSAQTTSETESQEQSALLTNDEIKVIVEELNKNYKDSKGKNHTAIETNIDGTYKVKSGFEEYVALNVMNNTNLTQSQKNNLLHDIFKVPNNKIRNVLSDNQYRYQNK